MKKSKDILKAGFLVLFVSLVILSTVLSLFEQSSKTPNGVEVTGVDDVSNEAVWDEYVNDEFFISFRYPRLLLKREYRNQGGYDLFVKFEENSLAQGKGVALGINKVGRQIEVDRVKESVGSGEPVVILSEREIEINGLNGVLLEFGPKDTEGSERRNVLVFEKDGITYSLSTVPGQMQDIMESLEVSP